MNTLLLFSFFFFFSFDEWILTLRVESQRVKLFVEQALLNYFPKRISFNAEFKLKLGQETLNPLAHDPRVILSAGIIISIKWGQFILSLFLSFCRNEVYLKLELVFPFFKPKTIK